MGTGPPVVVFAVVRGADHQEIGVKGEAAEHDGKDQPVEMNPVDGPLTDRVGHQGIGHPDQPVFNVIAAKDHEVARGFAPHIVVDQLPALIPLPGRPVKVGGRQTGEDRDVAL